MNSLGQRCVKYSIGLLLICHIGWIRSLWAFHDLQDTWHDCCILYGYAMHLGILAAACPILNQLDIRTIDLRAYFKCIHPFKMAGQCKIYICIYPRHLETDCQHEIIQYPSPNLLLIFDIIRSVSNYVCCFHFLPHLWCSWDWCQSSNSYYLQSCQWRTIFSILGSWGWYMKLP